MLRGEFYHKVRKLNKHLRIVCNDFDTMANGQPSFAGLGYWDEKEGWIPICAVDKHELCEYTEYDSGAHIIKTGWRRPVLALYHHRLATKKKIQEIFGAGFFENRHVDLVPVAMDPVKRILSAKMLENLQKTGTSALTNDNIREISSVMEELPQVKANKAKEEEELWNLKNRPDEYVAKAGQEAAAKAQGSFTNDPNAWPDLDAPVVQIPN